MTPIKARWYDGKTSQGRSVVLHPDPPHRLRVTGEGVDFSRSLDEVRPSSRVGNTRRHLYFSDGSQCETEDNDAVDAMFASARSGAAGRMIHRFESRLRYVVLACVLTAAALWGGITYVIPAIAKQIAFGLPASTEKAIGQDALAGLDNVLFEPTRLPPSRQAQLKALFSEMTSAIPGAGDYRLELRASRLIGANALALPSGIVVVTDRLVELAASDKEIAAVLAHEIGHLRQRHSLRRLLQASASTVLVIAVTGDIGSVASLGAALPTLLLEARYSREFEREADDFALDYMKGRGIPAQALGDILLRIEKEDGGRDVPDYLSTHPSTRERAVKPGP